jgi:glutamate-1-semialdehyde 2,1-aminomutase
LDEVVTGFRVAWGGCQELFGLHPDLSTYGKAIGGGFPTGAVAGRADIMALFHDRHGADGILAGGTSNGNAVSMVAAAAALTELRARRAEVYPWLNVESDRLANSVNSVCLYHGYGAQMMNASSIFSMRFQGGSIRTSRDVTHEKLAAADAFYLRLLHHRVIIPGIHMCFLSAAHHHEIVDDIATAIECTLAEVREFGGL